MRWDGVVEACSMQHVETMTTDIDEAAKGTRRPLEALEQAISVSATCCELNDVPLVSQAGRLLHLAEDVVPTLRKSCLASCLVLKTYSAASEAKDWRERLFCLL